MAKIIVLTDLHMTLNPRPGRPDPDARLAAALTHIEAHHADADALVLCGDLTHDGDRPAYERVRERLAETRLPVHPMLGNHDNRARFLATFPAVPVDPNGFVQRVVDLPGVRLILLDTLADFPVDDPRHHAGVLCDARLGWMSARIAEAGETPCILFLHHPPHDTGFPSMDAIKLVNGTAFYGRLAAHGNVVQLICGHIHRTISGSHRGVPFAVFKSPVGQMPMDLIGLDCHIENDDPAAYGILLVRPEGVLVHSEDYGLDQP